MKPIVAIVGRPNVGKSTLFNRLVGGHQAITLDVPGVTRDRHYGQGAWDAREFVVVDTGGLFLGEEGVIEGKIREQVDLAIAEADVILFVMDAREGLLPDEREIARYVRRSGKRVFFVANKIDSPQNEDKLSEFYELGEDVLPVSAEHSYRVNDLLDRVVAPWPKLTGEEEAEARPIRVSVIGRPNVGKSSLLNRLLGEDRLVVHDQPGTTRDAIDTPLTVDGKDYLLVDTAGIRRRGSWESKVERYSVLNSLKAIERCDVCVIVFEASDAVEGIHKQDAHVAGYAVEARKGVVLVWNKWDLIPSQERRSFLKRSEHALAFLSHAPVLCLSAKTGEGMEAFWPTINRLHSDCGRRIPTSAVNRVFEALIDSHNPPVFKGKPVKFFYATQTQTFPPTFIVFVSEPQGVHFSFKRYLVNGFRKAFEFGGAPVQLVFRRKRR